MVHAMYYLSTQMWEPVFQLISRNKRKPIIPEDSQGQGYILMVDLGIVCHWDILNEYRLAWAIVLSVSLMCMNSHIPVELYPVIRQPTTVSLT